MPRLSGRLAKRQGRRPIVTARQLGPVRSKRPPAKFVLTDKERAYLSAHIVVQPGRDACWLWNGDSTKYGHAAFRGLPCQAHRLMYGLFVGERALWDDHIHHRCEVRGCVNPAHLMRLTPKQHGEMHHRAVGGKS